MFNNKIVNIVFSILVAIGLWVYVVGEINPETTDKFSGVPVRFINAAVLAEDGLAVVDPGEMTADVTILGTRADMKGLDPSEIEITADLTGLSEGENKVALAVSLPDDLKLQSISTKKVTVVVEELVTAEKPVQIQYEGTVPEGKEPGAVTINPAAVQVSGAASTVEKIQYVSAKVAVADLKDTPSQFEITLKPVDKDGLPLPYLFLSQKEADIQVTLLNVKTVPLRLEVTGDVPDGFILESKTLPESITIKGTASALEGVEVLYGDDIDLSRLTESVDLPIQLTLPDGVEVADASLNPTLELTISPVAAKEFTYDSDSLTTKGLAAGLAVDLPNQSIILTARASDQTISSLVAEDFTLSLNLTGLKAGTYKVAVEVETAKSGLVYSTSPKEIQIVIREE